jgi:exodeoxyribonuclease V alpha subunit
MLEPTPAYPARLSELVAAGDLDQGRAFLAWQLAQLARDLASQERDDVVVLVARLLAAESLGSTRLLVSDADRRLLAKLPDLAGRPGRHTPLIVDGNYLYSERAHGCEERIARAIAGRLALPSTFLPLALAAVVRDTASHSTPAPTDEQRRAVTRVLERQLGAISGGPGTGKTTTAITLVRSLARLGVPAARIALCAPTGKAASRLEDDLRRRLGQLEKRPAEDERLLAECPKAQTLHRLLGVRPGARGTARAEGDVLPFAAVIVDESSMIDLVLMDRLLASLAKETLLVLLGDADQLPSVSAGAVFRDLGSISIRLERGFRTQPIGTEGSDLATLARTIQTGDAEACIRLCQSRESPDQVRGASVEHVEAPHRDEVLRRYHQALFRAPDVVSLVDPVFVVREGGLDEADTQRLARLSAKIASARVLAVTQERITGVERSNAFLHGGGAHFLPGEPVLMLRNDYQRELWNGDQGIAIRVRRPGQPASVQVAFPSRRGWQLVDPATMGFALTLGFALTVHKSQGSEFDAVTLLLPDAPCALLTRELVYTALSRARRSVLICGPLAMLKSGVTMTEKRSSGVAERLPANVTTLT